MRISDWSSDVCSSDLAADRCRVRLAPVVGNLRPRDEGRVRDPGRHRAQHRQGAASHAHAAGAPCDAVRRHLRPGGLRLLPARAQLHVLDGAPRLRARDPLFEQAIGVDSKFALAYAGRSEEHTSELQSLMRISYAVFCLQKKKNKTIDNTN